MVDGPPQLQRTLEEAARVPEDRGTELLLEGTPQHIVHLWHRDRNAEIDQACDPVLRHAAGNDAREMPKVRFDIEADAVKGHPAAHAYADGGDLVLGERALVRAPHPDT